MKKRTKGGIFKNKGESLKSRNREKFEESDDSYNEGDFDIIEKAPDSNPQTNNAVQNLRQNPWFMLSYDEELLGEDLMAESDTDEEADDIQAMLQRSNTQTRTLFQGAS